MIEVRLTTAATPGEVFAVLADGWVYPSWVVGASRMRAVDDHWPSIGARLHHSFGVWPALVDDTTEVMVVEEPNLLVLTARGWPIGYRETLQRLLFIAQGRAGKSDPRNLAE